MTRRSRGDSSEYLYGTPKLVVAMMRKPNMEMAAIHLIMKLRRRLTYTKLLVNIMKVDETNREKGIMTNCSYY